MNGFPRSVYTTPMADELERSSGTSPESEQVETAPVEREPDAGPTAAEATPPVAETSGKTTPEVPEPKPSELDKRIEHLTDPDATGDKPPTDEKPKREKEPSPETDEANPHESPDLSPEMKKRMPKEAAQAFAAMRISNKELINQVQQASEQAPVAQFGSALLESLGEDGFAAMQALEDEDIKSALLDRLAIKQGKKPATAGIDPAQIADLESALTKAEESYDFDAVKAILAKLKGEAKPAAAAPTPGDRGTQTMQQERQPANQQGIDRETLHVNRTRSAILADGVPAAELKSYVEGRILPLVLSQLAKDYPGIAPGASFNALDPADRSILLLDAHRAEQARSPRPAPKPPVAQTRPRTPLTAGAAGRRPAPVGGQPPATDLSGRVGFLTD